MRHNVVDTYHDCLDLNMKQIRVDEMDRAQIIGLLWLIRRYLIKDPSRHTCPSLILRQTDLQQTSLINQDATPVTQRREAQKDTHPLGETNHPDDEHRQTEIAPRKRRRLATIERRCGQNLEARAPACHLPLPYISSSCWQLHLVGAEQQLKQTFVARRLHVRRLSEHCCC